MKFATKFVNTKRNQDRQNVEREIEVMKALNEQAPHPRLIQLYDAFDMGKEMCLVLEVVEGGELFERVIDDDFVLTERACAIFIKQICEGIEYIHTKNVLHLDMKPENILCLSREGNRVKICDFGLARKYDPRKKLQVLFGTPEFVAPEVVNFEPISFGTDMWSIGVICYVLLSGLSPFMGHNYVETMTNVTHNKYDFDDEAFDDVSSDVRDFIEKLLMLDKSERLTPTQCIRHPWIKKVLSSQPQNKIPKPQETHDIILTKPEVIADNLIAKSEDENHYNENQNEIQSSKIQNFSANQENHEKHNKGDNIEYTKDHNFERIENTNDSNILNKVNNTELEDKNECHMTSPHDSLELTKKHLKDFVDRKSSRINSSILIASPEDTSEIFCIDTSEIPQETKVDLDVNMVDCKSDVKENSQVETAVVTPEEIIIQLGHKLKQLEHNISCNSPKKRESLENKEAVDSSKRARVDETEVVENISESQRTSTENKNNFLDSSDKNELGKELLKAPNIRENIKRPEKEHTTVKLKPSRDVEFSYDQNGNTKNTNSFPTTPDRSISPIPSPSRRSRRHSRDERSERSLERTTMSTRIHRRPSRDIPMNALQLDKLKNTSQNTEKTLSQEIWPDMICVSQEKDGDSDEQSESPKPLTAKLELSVIKPGSTLAVKKERTPEPQITLPIEKPTSKNNNFEGLEESTKEGKVVTWLLDIGKAKHQSQVAHDHERLPMSENLKDGNENKKTSNQEQNSFPSLANDLGEDHHIRDRSCSPISPSMSKRDSSSSLKSSSSSDNLTVVTPWGPMRRSPSKASLTTSNNTNIIFININEFSKEDNHPKKKDQLKIMTSVSKIVEKKENINKHTSMENSPLHKSPSATILSSPKITASSSPSSSSSSSHSCPPPSISSSCCSFSSSSPSISSSSTTTFSSSISSSSSSHPFSLYSSSSPLLLTSSLSLSRTSFTQEAIISENKQISTLSEIPSKVSLKSESQTIVSTKVSPIKTELTAIKKTSNLIYTIAKNKEITSEVSSILASHDLNSKNLINSNSKINSTQVFTTKLNLHSSKESKYIPVSIPPVTSIMTSSHLPTLSTTSLTRTIPSTLEINITHNLGSSTSRLINNSLESMKDKPILKDLGQSKIFNKSLETDKLPNNFFKERQEKSIIKLGLEKVRSMHDIPAYKSHLISNGKTEDTKFPNATKFHPHSEKILGEKFEREENSNKRLSITERYSSTKKTPSPSRDILSKEQSLTITKKSTGVILPGSRTGNDIINISTKNETISKVGVPEIEAPFQRQTNRISITGGRYDKCCDEHPSLQTPKLKESSISPPPSRDRKASQRIEGKSCQTEKRNHSPKKSQESNLLHPETRRRDRSKEKLKYSPPPTLLSPSSKTQNSLPSHSCTTVPSKLSEGTGGSKFRERQDELPPKPPDERCGSLKRSNRHSLIEVNKHDEDGSPALARRRSRPKTPILDHKGLGICLFSAQDRISLFEQKKDHAPRIQKPFVRSKTIHYSTGDLSKDNISSRMAGASRLESKLISPSVVSTRV